MNPKRLLILLVSLVAIAGASAQMSLPTIEIANKKFGYYIVENKETVHGVSQKLGVSIETILETNPWANSGLVKKQLLFVPVEPDTKPAPESVNVEKSTAITYTLGANENIYTVVKKFNASIEGLINANIKLQPSQYVEGAKIKVVAGSALPFAYETSTIKFYEHKVQKKETFASIAALYGVTESTLQRINPSVNKPKKNKNIVVPRIESRTILGTIKSISMSDLERHYQPRIDNIYQQLVEDHRNSVCNVGIILPFQADKTTPPKQAYLYTDFLKGFMIAMDSLGTKATRKINVKVYDTQHNLSVTDRLLAKPEMQELNFIIAPGEPQQLDRINAFASKHDIPVLNCFSTKNEDYLSNSNILQVNTPTPTLIDNLTQWARTRFNDCTIIYLEDDEACEMYNLIKSDIAELGLATETTRVNDEFTAETVSRILNPGSNYLFIPSNSNKSLLKKIIPALKENKAERFDCEMNLLGYPEYILYLKDYQNDLMTIDTYMYSRFFNAKGFRTRNLEASYRKWFGGSMLESYPHMGLFGFDTGVFLINTLGAGGEIDETAELFKGIQTGFKFSHTSNSAGLVNQAVTIVHFSPDKKIESFVAIDR